MKKRTILLALLFAATGLSPLQAQKKYKAYIVSNSAFGYSVELGYTDNH